MIIKRPRPKSGLEKAIDNVLLEMEKHSPTNDSYALLADQLVKLHTLKINEKKTRVSPDTLFTIGANIAGIVMILEYERIHIITSKAIAFVRKI